MLLKKVMLEIFKAVALDLKTAGLRIRKVGINVAPTG
jgi:hypothetical protein